MFQFCDTYSEVSNINCLGWQVSGKKKKKTLKLCKIDKPKYYSWRKPFMQMFANREKRIMQICWNSILFYSIENRSEVMIRTLHNEFTPSIIDIKHTMKALTRLLEHIKRQLLKKCGKPSNDSTQARILYTCICYNFTFDKNASDLRLWIKRSFANIQWNPDH